MRINHNIAALNTYRQLGANGGAASKNLEKLSSGLRINRAGDDAAGLAISEKMRGQIRGLEMASRNAQDGISLIQTAEGALNETHSILQRMRELATQAANDTNTSEDRGEIQSEINQLSSEINRVGNTTEFNTQKLLNGGSAKTHDIRYTVAAKGVAETTPTGDTSVVNVLTSSVNAGTGAVSSVTKVTDSVAAAGSAEGQTTSIYTNTASAQGGTGEVQLFRVDVSSVKAANNGTVSPMEEVTASVIQGTGDANFETVVSGSVTDTATYGIEIMSNFTEGDTITIGSQTFTAVTSGAGVNEFNIGSDISTTRDNMIAALGGATFNDGGTTYNISTSDPQWTAYNDNNLIVLTDAAGPQVDANAAAMNSSTITQVSSQQGVYEYEISDNFETGQKINIGGIEFTAVASGGNTATNFEVGADVEATATNLKAAMDLAKAGGAYSDYTLTQGSGIHADTITLTEVAATGNALTDASITNITEQAGTYSFEVKMNFTAGDKIDIDGVELIAGTDFAIGADATATSTNIMTGIQANTTLNAHYNVAASAGSNGNNLITLTEKAVQADGSDMSAPVVTKYAETVGEYDFSVLNNFEVGEKVTIDGQEFVAISGTRTSGSNEFQVGASSNDTVTSLKAALTDKLGDQYTVGGAAAQITLTEKSGMADGVGPTISAVSPVGEIRGEFNFKITSDFSVGDTIEIEGQTFTAVSGTAVASAGEFSIAGDIEDATDSLISAINANTSIGSGVRFTASKETDNTDPLNPVYTVKLIEDNGLATGDNTVTATVNPVTEVAGIYTFDVTTNFAAGEKLEIGGQTLVAGDSNSASTFAIGADADTTAGNIKAAMDLNTNLSTRFTISSSGNSIALTEKTGEATGTDLSDPIVKGDATAGEYKFSMNALKAGTKVTIDGTELTFVTGGTESQTASELKTLVENDSTLNAKYAIQTNGAEVTLTQKAGQESANAPTLQYNTLAGSGFTADMQIGANTGQSMTVSVDDMRTLALGITSSSNSSNQTVTVNGMEYSVDWTSVQSVTDGTNNISNQYALNVSDADSATAAIEVVNQAINKVSAQRSKLGAFQNRLEHTINNVGTSAENLTAAESRIRDVDMAKEMMEFTKNNILSQAAQAMLAQANQQPQGVLQLLR